jgi:prevent-host-death family protein
VKTATVRDLRNSFPRIAAWVEEGEPVEITRGGKPFARLVPVEPPKPTKFNMPDIGARLRKTYGDRVYDSDDIARGISESRGD